MDAGHRYIIVGVVPGQEPAVVLKAACFAAAFDAELVCAWVDASRYEVDTDDGLPAVDRVPRATSIDPDLADDEPLEFPVSLADEIAQTLHDVSVRYATRALAGGTLAELDRLADELNADMIVVGTRKPGFRGTIHEFFSGSVAVQLAHHQHRPVVVIPVRPVGLGSPPPWSPTVQRS